MRVHVLSAVASFALIRLSLAATPVATYEFNNTFAADQAGVPALTAVDPLGTSTFTTDTVLGVSRPVWAFNGANSPPSQQAGLSVSTTSLISPESYSVDMVFLFSEQQNAWRRIIDVQNRQSDAGFYVNPSNNLEVFPVSGSSAAWTNNIYHHIVLTDNGTMVSGYLDGVSQFSANTSLLNLDADPTSNPNRLISFFIDNVVGGGQGEWSAGRVGLIRLWDGVLTAHEAQTLATNPFIPEPSSIAVVLLVGGVLFTRNRRMR